MKNIEILADIFQKQEKGREILAAIEADIALVAAKLDKLGKFKRKRVFRLMGRDKIMTPTAHAFLNQLVIKAGGIPMAPEGEGMVTPVSLEEWQAFNPQVIFGCGEDRRAADKFFTQKGWKDVEAVQKGQGVLLSPASSPAGSPPTTGYFIKWLAATLYNDEFYKSQCQIFPDEILNSEKVPISLDMVKQSCRVTSRIADFKHKTLVIDFKSPQTVLSTLEGFRTGVTTVANHYLPPPAWNMPHSAEMAGVNARILKTMKRDPATSALLMTGADMDHVTVTRKTFKEMAVTRRGNRRGLLQCPAGPPAPLDFTMNPAPSTSSSWPIESSPPVPCPGP